MAAKGSGAATPTVAYSFDDARGEHQIGLHVGDHFVPLVSLTEQQLQDRLDAAQSPEAGPTTPPTESDGE